MTVVTIWFVSCDDPRQVLLREPDVDRGFGRKYLAQLDPSQPVTHIADFPLNRSAPAGTAEFYIGGFDGLAVIQTAVEGQPDMTQLPKRLTRNIAADDIYVIAEDPDNRWAGFAHFHDGAVRRAFAATGTRIIVNDGLPLPAERGYWAGEHDPAESGRPGVALPFKSAELAHAVIASWLGFDPTASGPDVPVSAFAVDGRLSSKIDTTTKKRATAPDESSAFDYDDYEAVADDDINPTERLQQASEATRSAAQSLGEQMRGFGRRIWDKLNSRNR
ncbi:hypothetical protein KRX51_06400 [Corynebacterium sp. TAE3-ERU12]|uniref:DUF6928 family protein n=1 Tax=Corynebacterium sp. TAE3-ERU12 TaxID=2849491 RepID=UPI001C48E6BA|nr:hypothetical protein [Corynebacterium sp. TAE3-ERU12]MBV7295547.1 hypothetical protein [Corynebacterium sp. TAE3-ERU12]